MFKGKVVIITGASSGIGRACAEEFAAQGAHLVLGGKRLWSHYRISRAFKSEDYIVRLLLYSVM